MVTSSTQEDILKVRTFAIVNQKGGSGKTTTAINLAAIFAHRGQRTLLIDLDPQSHCATGLGVPEGCVQKSISEVLLADDVSQLDRSEFLWEAARNLDLIPSTMRLAGLEAPGGGLHQRPDRDRRLVAVLAALSDNYDRCVIDCPPTIGLLTFNALRAARETLIPVETGFFALRGAEKQWRTIRQLVDRLGRPIACHMIATIYDERSSLATEILSALRRRFAGQILPVVIRENEALREAISFGQPVIEYAPNSQAAADYKELADWLDDHPPRRGVEIEVMAGRHEPLPAHFRPITPAALASSRFPGDRPREGRAEELARRVRTFRQQREAQAKAAESPNPQSASSQVEVKSTIAPADRPVDLSQLVDPQTHPTLTFTQPQAITLGHPHAATTLPNCGVNCTDKGVMFVQPGQATTSIAVAGDFNQWSPTATPLHHQPQLGVQQALVQIPPGLYQYRLIINGRWQADPYNARTQLNEYGEPNSVLIVPESTEGSL